MVGGHYKHPEKGLPHSPVYNRISNNLKNIIIKFVEKGNVIISDVWVGYNNFSSANSGYIH